MTIAIARQEGIAARRRGVPGALPLGYTPFCVLPRCS